jgi:hypothetical protein
MSWVRRSIDEVESSDKASPYRSRSPYPLWPPRLSTIVAGLFVGFSLFWMNFVDHVFAGALADKYGWPFTCRLTSPKTLSFSQNVYTAAMVADLAISAALLVSACVTTQLMACLLARSRRLTLADLIIVIAAAALLLAGCRLEETFLPRIVLICFFYSLGSLIVLLICRVLHLELPRTDDPVERE